VIGGSCCSKICTPINKAKRAACTAHRAFYSLKSTAIIKAPIVRSIIHPISSYDNHRYFHLHM
jgi:hypothetical protein